MRVSRGFLLLYGISGRRQGSSAPRVARIGLAAGVSGISGFVALVLEVTWTRILALVLGPTTYAFSAMLVAFITGLAIGSSFAAALLRRIRRPDLWLGVAIGAAAVAALVLCWRIDRVPLAIMTGAAASWLGSARRVTRITTATASIASLVRLGQNDRARDAFERSARANPQDPAVLVNLGTIELRSANPRSAAERFAEALTLSPTLEPALSGLADALEQQGLGERTSAIRKRLRFD